MQEASPWEIKSKCCYHYCLPCGGLSYSSHKKAFYVDPPLVSKAKRTNFVLGIIEVLTETQPRRLDSLTTPPGFFSLVPGRCISKCDTWSCQPSLVFIFTVALDDQLSFDWLWHRHAIDMALFLFPCLFAHAADLLKQMTVGRLVSKRLLCSRLLGVGTRNRSRRPSSKRSSGQCFRWPVDHPRPTARS